MLFSIIMPAYNSEKYIESAIESVLNQTYKNWELVIINDGSIDGTSAILEQFVKDDRITIISQENSGTAAAARNTALDYISGDYVLALDSDDLIAPNMLEEYSKVLISNEFDIIVPNCVYFSNDDITNVEWAKYPPNKDYKLSIDGEKAFELSLDWKIHGLFLIKQEIIRKIKYDPHLINGDEFTTRKLLFNANRVGFADTYYYYRKNKESTTQSKKNNYRMFEYIITARNIYNYSITNKMKRRVVNKCINNWMIEFFSYGRLFYRLQNDKENSWARKKAFKILNDAYYDLKTDIWKNAKLKYKMFFFLSKGDVKTFFKLISFIAKF